MLFNFFKKQKKIKDKKELIIVIVNSLYIKENQKTLYIEALETLDKEWVDRLYMDFTLFIEKEELADLEDINKENFAYISWMRKKEAIDKQKEINSFSFLLHNI